MTPLVAAATAQLPCTVGAQRPAYIGTAAAPQWEAAVQQALPFEFGLFAPEGTHV